VAWHRKGFRLFWTWKVRHGQPGRPVISSELRGLIRKMCRENPSWGAPQIHGELLKLGIDIAESSVKGESILLEISYSTSTKDEYQVSTNSALQGMAIHIVPSDGLRDPDPEGRAWFSAEPVSVSCFCSSWLAAS
jgi:hypothetical protein